MVNENITSLLEQEAEAVRNIPVTPGYEEAVSLIVKHVHDLGGKLIMSGMGKAGQIALNIATTFSSTGTPAVNHSLSVSRAEFIAAELKRRGIPDGTIVKAGIGGIADHTPVEANRHTKVELFFPDPAGTAD